MVYADVSSPFERPGAGCVLVVNNRPAAACLACLWVGKDWCCAVSHSMPDSCSFIQMLSEPSWRPTPILSSPNMQLLQLTMKAERVSRDLEV